MKGMLGRGVVFACLGVLIFIEAVKAQDLSAIGRIRSTEKSAILRSKPSEKSDGKDISALMFVIQSCSATWCKVRVPLKGSKLVGWVRRDAIEIVSGSIGNPYRRPADLFPRETSTACDALSPQPLLNVSLNRFKCSEGIFSEGFERCSAEVLYNVQFSCDPPPTLSVTLNCELSYEYDVQDGSMIFPSRATADERKYLYPLGRYDSGTMDIDVRLSSIFSPVVRVKPKDLSCRTSQF